MKILFATQRVPYPPDRGDKIATFNIVKHLQRNNEVVVCCLADGPDDLAYAEELQSQGLEIYAIATHSLRALWRTGWALPTSKSLSVAYLNEPGLHKAVAQVMARGDIDAAVIYSSNAAQFVRKFSGLPKIMHFSDLDSQKFAQYAAAKSWPLNWIYRLEAKRLLNHEREVAASVSHSLVCTEKERADFQRLIPGPPVSCIANGVDLDYFSVGQMPRQRDHLVFTGVMNYYPNVEGMVWFCQEILPRIRQRFPGVRLTICGSRPDAEIQKLGKIDNVEVTGRVADVRDYLNRACVAVVPLRLARGIQNKVLEAMSTGLPTVATTTATLGVQAEDGRDLLIADDDGDFAAAVCDLLQNPARRVAMGQNARAIMEKNYSWPEQMDKLEAIVKTAIAAGATKAPS